jgi:serine/threonine protein phosphatase PrpC
MFAPVQLQAIPTLDHLTADTVSWTYGSSSEQNGRSHMEDRILTADLTSDAAFAGAGRAVLLGVFDGHAGSTTAQYLSSSMVGHLLAEGGAALQQDPAGSMGRAVGRAEGVLMTSWSPACGPASGSTLCMGLVLGSVLHVVHAGDSRAVLARSGRALQLTQDHKPSSEAERERIHAADPSAQVSSDGYLYGELGVSRGMGSAHIKADPTKSAYIAAPELCSIQLEERDDFIILASDGLWDVVSSIEAVTAARKSLAAKRDAAAAAALLVERAKQLGSTDNISVVVMRLHGRPITLPTSNSRLFRRPASAPPAMAVEAAA